MGQTRSLHIDGRHLELGHLDKVFYPETGLTKGDLIDYHRRIAETSIPWMRDRPLVMRRYPDGIDGEGFFQKQRPSHFPDWIEEVTVSSESAHTIYVVGQDTATLVYLVDQGCVEIHTWLARTDAPFRPDQMVFDLDPSRALDEGGVEDVRHGARILRALLTALDVPVRVKSSGSRGLHLHVPLEREADNRQVSDLALGIAEAAVARDPERLTVAQRTEARQERLFIDTLRNHRAQHAIAPFAVRARPGAPVAVPLRWSEALSSEFHPRRITIENVFRRLAHQNSAPWEDRRSHRSSVARVRRRLVDLT